MVKKTKDDPGRQY